MKIFGLLETLLLGISIAGCEQEEVELYNQTPRINFSASVTYCLLSDADYLNYVNGERTDTMMQIGVQLQGGVLRQTLDFCLDTVSNAAYAYKIQLELADKYTFEASDELKMSVPVRVKIPALPQQEDYKMSLKFALDNPKHQFGPGRADRDSLTLKIRYTMRPREAWSVNWFGKYSDAKYCFMIDVFRKLYKEIPKNADSRILLIRRYNQYKEKWGRPILDYDGNEIQFN